MAIEFGCPVCQGTLRVGDDAVGRVVRCGSCLTMLRVPDAPPAPEPPPERWEPSPSPPVPPRRATAEPVAPGPRPRRRPRPATPKSGGKSALFWVLLVMGILGVLTVAGCAGLVLLLQPHWRTHESAAGGFKVDLPADPNDDIEDMVQFRNKANASAEGTFLWPNEEAYVVIYADLEPRDLQGNDDDNLKEAVAGLQRDTPGMKVVRITPLPPVSGWPATEVIYSHPEHGIIFCRIVLTDTRAYLVMAGGRQLSAAGNERVRRFLDSFAITDPKLQAKAAERKRLADLAGEGARQARERGKAQPRDPDPPLITDQEAMEMAEAAARPALRLATPLIRRR